MKIVQINTFSYKSTGHIMMDLHKILTEQGYDSYVCWGRGREAENDHEIVISDDLGVKFHGVYTRVFDKTGFASKRATRKLIKRLEEIQPDIIHLHNIHGYYLNIEMLFNYIREHKIKVVWTLHDCWAFTGHCSWFDVCGCDKWKTGCHNCEQLKTYPASQLIDNSRWNWEKKKELFIGLDITIVTPSQWLANLVKESFLREYPVKVINNGIDTSVFYKRDITALREKYGFDQRKIVLGVASEWTPRKGLNDFIELSRNMPEVQFVVVGLNDKQFKEIPETIKGIKRTNCQDELAELYSLADVFFNPTYEDNYPTTNLEALSCGTPVVTYDTGGSPEIINALCENKLKCGIIEKKSTSAKIDLTIVENGLKECITDSKIREDSKCASSIQMFDYRNKLLEYQKHYDEILK